MILNDSNASTSGDILSESLSSQLMNMVKTTQASRAKKLKLFSLEEIFS